MRGRGEPCPLTVLPLSRLSPELTKGVPKDATFPGYPMRMSSMAKPPVDPRFSERLARIEAARAMPAAKQATRRPRFSGIGYALSLVGAFAVGGLVVFAARYARFHLTGMVPGTGELGRSTLATDILLAFLAGFVLQQIFNFRRAEHTGAKTFGMIVAVFTMHMAVHAFPGLFETLFSDVWVHQVTRLTDPTRIAVF